MNKQDIKNLTPKELEKLIIDMSQPVYRAKQVFSWLYKKGAENFSAMSNLPDGLIKKLNESYYIGALKLDKHLKSKEGAEKFIFKLSDGNFIESVFIESKYRGTICISTQVGCKFGCCFCASGSMGFIRNLTASEIVSQFLFLRHKYLLKITNCVFMGMGEPLDNYYNTEKAIRIINDPKGIGLGARKITVSTCGIIPGIERLARLGLQVNLSISLHATSDRLRSELMPINKIYSIKKLINACHKYIEQSKRLITIEYILIKDKNDSPKDADALALVAQDLRAKVNLIAYSEIPSLKFKAPSPESIELFIKRLESKGMEATLQRSKGKDIQAACGMLAGKIEN